MAITVTAAIAAVMEAMAIVAETQGPQMRNHTEPLVAFFLVALAVGNPPYKVIDRMAIMMDTTIRIDNPGELASIVPGKMVHTKMTST